MLRQCRPAAIPRHGHVLRRTGRWRRPELPAAPATSPAATASSTCASPRPAPATRTVWVGWCSARHSRCRATASAPSPPHGIVTDAGLRLHRRQSRLRDLLRRVLRVFRRLHPPDPASALHADANRMEADDRRGVDQSRIPAPVVQGFWADTRNVILPDGSRRRRSRPTNPGSSTACRSGTTSRPGRENCRRRMLQRRLARSERLQRGIFAGQSLCRRADHLQAGQHSSRLSRCSWRTAPAVQRFFRLTIRLAACVVRLPHPSTGRCRRRRRPITEADIVIGAFSSVTGSVVIDAGADRADHGHGRGAGEHRRQRRGHVERRAAARRRQDERDPGDRRRRKPNDHRDSRARRSGHSHRHAPVGGPAPDDDDAIHAAAVHPAGDHRPLHATAVHPADRIVNPFTQQPFTQQTTVYDVIDITFPVTPGRRSGGCGLGAAGRPERAADDRELPVPGHHQPRVAARRRLEGCSSVDDGAGTAGVEIRAPFTQQPFTQQPFTQQPFTQQPFTQQPFTQQPFTQQPFTQQSNPSDPVNSNSTFYLAPSPTPDQSARLRLPGSGRTEVWRRGSRAARSSHPSGCRRRQDRCDYRARRADLGLTYTLRAFQISVNPPVRIVDPVTGQANVGVTVVADTPEVW